MRTVNWAAERRLDYIDFRLVTAGTVRRADIMRTFGVSLPQASGDLSHFMRLYRKALLYDKSAKQYVPRHEGYQTRRGFTPNVIRAFAQLRSAGHALGWQ